MFLTESGREAIRAIEKSVRKTEKQALKGFDKKEQKLLSKLLARIEANLSDATPVDVDDDGDTRTEPLPQRNCRCGRTPNSPHDRKSSLSQKRRIR